MSPNPGEPGHEQRGWNHAICDRCFFGMRRSRGWAAMPTRVSTDNPWGAEPCCYCGALARGIYVRDDSATVHVHPVPA